MQRTTIEVKPETVERLRRIADQRGVSFAQVVREALDAKAMESPPRPRSLGLFSSGRSDGSEASFETLQLIPALGRSR